MKVEEQKQASIRETLYGVVSVTGISRIFLNMLTFWGNWWKLIEEQICFLTQICKGGFDIFTFNVSKKLC